ncbi:uncharacterized protein LOC111626567 [Centruroides sculpturatus]|uniref:uncharacterized protein LOC111626567 n=1 Tax=Centruroides sculpturatus TaxID=218467 RepID=UPI000C6D0E6D|nr:uncharacterized protein LOC111626567 [Centruroides sculpturatus]
MAEAEINDDHRHIAHVAIRPPPFWKGNPNLWFAQLEAQFSINNITVDDTKFKHVVAAIEPEILNLVQDLILNPPNQNKFSMLKARLIDIYSESETSKIRTLLQGLELGDQRPSFLLSRMHDLTGNYFSEDLLQSLWLSRLPHNVQAILAVSKEKLQQQATMADKIMEFISSACIQTVEHDLATISTLKNQVAELAQQVKNLTISINNQCRCFTHSEYPPNNRRRCSKSRKNQQHSTPHNGRGYYHECVTIMLPLGSRRENAKPLAPSDWRKTD